MKIEKYSLCLRKGLCKLLSLCLFFCAVALTAQVGSGKKEISGMVSDAAGETLVGVTVMEKGTTNGVTTDFDGSFTLNVKGGSTVVISYIGFVTQEFSASDNKNWNIVLKESNKALEEVVVVGYGSTVKKDLTTAVISVSDKNFLQGASNNVMQMIEGKVAGLSISGTAGGDPNRNGEVQVRGASSMKGGNTPLIVIDGMPGGDLRSIAQQDIESITVLKDASAAAIYGSRAANGVILVQTKQGASGKTRITYNAYFEHDGLAKRPDVLSRDEFLSRNRDTDHKSDTDWYGALINKNNFGHNHNVSLSGGSESSIFRISATYKEKEAIDIVTERKEYGVRGSFKQITLENLLEVSGNLSYRFANEVYAYSNDRDDEKNYGVFKQAIKLNPTINVNETQMFKGVWDEFNPVNFLRERDFRASQEYLTTDFNIRLNLTKDLNSELKLARQGRNMKQYQFFTKYHKESLDENRDGRAKLKSENWTDWTLEWVNNYAVKKGKNDIKAMLAYSYQEFNHEMLFAENAHFANDFYQWNQLEDGAWNKEGGAERLGMESEKDKEKSIAFIGRVNYNYDDTYLLTASLRYEGNTKFGPSKKWGYFPAASAAWRFSRLPVFENLTFVDDLKLRLSYGQTGRSGFDKYIAMSKYKGEGYSYVNGKWIQTYGPENNPNDLLKWEKQVSYNLGIDYTLLKNKITGSLDAFIRDGWDVIGEYRTAQPPMIYDMLTTNVGTTRDKGVELQFNWDVFSSKDFSYSTNLIGAYTVSKIKSFSKGDFIKGYLEGDGLPSPGNPGPAQRLADGMEVSSFYIFRYAGVDKDGQILIYENGEKGANTKLASDAKETDRAYLGHGRPHYELSWGNVFNYKNFDLGLFFRGKFDYKILNTYQMYYGLVSEPKVNLLQSAYDKNAHIKGSKVICDYFLENGDYFKLDNITLGWTPKIKSKYISNLRLYGAVKNVFTLTKYSGLDPTTVETTGLWAGVANLEVYPVVRNFTIGVQISY